MKITQNKSGFTLIEIIVVLIIVGVLAAIALPNLFSNIERSKAHEAIAALSSLRQQIEGCGQGHGQSLATCVPATTSNAYWTYSIATTGTLGQYTITATRVGGMGTVIVSRATSAADAVCSGTGSYQGVC